MAIGSITKKPSKLIQTIETKSGDTHLFKIKVNEIDTINIKKKKKK